jgi:hypothetical protein
MNNQLMKIKLLFRVILLTGLFMGFATVISAQVAELNLKKGLAKIIRGDDVQIINKLGIRLPLRNGDHVQTGANSKAEITLKFNKEVIHLSSRSFFEVDDVNAEQSKIALLTGKGQFKIPKKKLSKKRKKPRFKVRTVTAVVGVRGTEFVMGTGNEQTSLLTLSGEVTMAPVSAPDIEVVIPQNQASTVVQGAAPTKPVTVPPETRANIVSSDSSETFKQVSFPKPVSIEKAKKKKKAAKKKEEKKKEEKKKEEKKKEEKKKEEKKKEDAKKDDKKDTEKKSSEKKDADKKDAEKGDTKENGKKVKEDESKTEGDSKAEPKAEPKAEGDSAEDEEGDQKAEGELKSGGLKAGTEGEKVEEADVTESEEGPVETEEVDEKDNSALALTDGAEETEIKGAELDETELNEPEIAEPEIAEPEIEEPEIEEPEINLDDLINNDVMDELEAVAEDVADVEEEDVVTEDVVTEDVVTEDVVTEDVVTEDVVTEDVVEDVIEDVEETVEDAEETAAETEKVIDIKITRCDDVNVICP